MGHFDVAPLDGYDPEIGLLLASLVDSTREWRENLGAPSPEAICFQQKAKGRSMGGLMLHLIECELYWFTVVVAGLEIGVSAMEELRINEIDPYEDTWPTLEARPIEWYYELHDRYRKQAFDALKGARPQDLRQRPNGEVFSVRWIVSHVLQHDSYHGGQAVVLHEMLKSGLLSR